MKVLIIEDDEQTLKIYTEALTKAGYEVLQEKTANFPLSKLASQKPNLIILDIMLPGKMNGFDLLEKIVKDNDLKKIPVLVLTNLDSEEKVAKDIGATDYLVKANTSISDVVRKVRELIK